MTALSKQYRYNVVAQILWEPPDETPDTVLQDDRKAADYLSQLRWPAGVTCPRYGGDAVAPRARCANGLQRFPCVPGAVRLGQLFAMFTDWARSLFEESQLSPLEWLLVM